MAFEWSTFHGASLFVTHPLAMAGGAYLLITIAFPSLVGGSHRPDDRLRVDRIRASGDALAAAGSSATRRGAHRSVQLDQDDPVVVALRRSLPSSRGKRAPGISWRVHGPRHEIPSAAVCPTATGAFVLSLVFAAVAIPFSSQLGSFGVLWSIGLIAIIGYNAWTYVFRNRDRW